MPAFAEFRIEYIYTVPITASSINLDAKYIRDEMVGAPYVA
jgi:hypothetical protein